MTEQGFTLGPPAPLPWDEEQRRLGVGVKIQRRPRRHLGHAPALAGATAALHAGARAPVAEIVAARLAALRARLWRSPYYRARLADLGGSPNDLTDLAALEAFPTLSRDEYARVWTQLFDRDEDPELHLATSSGSTGQALLVPRSGYDGLHMWAVIGFFVEHLGVTLPARPRLTLLCTLPGGLEYSVRAPQFHDGALHRISTLRPHPDERLRKTRPAILSTDPAGLAWLLARPEHPRPALVLSSAQTLPPSLAAAARAALDAPLVNYYATTELGPIAWECGVEAGRFHVLHPDVWVESLAGELAITRLRDSPLPLVRYLTGDRGEVRDGDCACGVRGRSVVGFSGRAPCEFRLPDGRRIDAWTLSWLFKDLPFVRFELAQTGPEEFALRLAPSVTMDLDLLEERLRRALVRLGFVCPVLTVTRAVLPPQAKPCPFVCRVRRSG